LVTARIRVKCPESRGIVYTNAKPTRELRDDLALLPGYDVVHMPLAADVPAEVPADALVDAPAIVVAPAEKLIPWPHQTAAVRALDSWMWDQDRQGALVMPPGSGKTMVMALWGRGLDKIVVCSPTRALAAQTMLAMAAHMPGHRTLLVDSDDLGTRNPTAITQAWSDGSILLSTTYASMCDVVSGVVASSPNDAVVMVDEAHHMATNVGLAAAVVGIGCPVLHVTGTPPAALLDDDDESVQVVYQYDYDRAVADGRVCDFRIYLPLIVDPVDTDHDALVLALGHDMVSRCHFLVNGMLRTGATRCIVYAGSCTEASEYETAVGRLCREFHGVAAWSATITGETSTAERDRVLSAFQAADDQHRMFFMCSVRVLDEGIDVPACDAVYIAHPIGNRVRFVQRLCRANRLDYLGKVANVFVWSDDADLDTTLCATVQVARELGNRSPVVYQSTDYGSRVDVATDRALVERVRVLCISTAERWAMRLEQTGAFLDRHGRLPSTCAKDPVVKRLGQWVSHQKTNYSEAGPESSKYIMKTSVHAEWTALVARHPLAFESAQATWQRSAGEVEKFVQQNGRLPSHQGNNVIERQLGEWVSKQKKSYAADPATSTRIMRTPEVHTKWTAFIKLYPLAFETAEATWRESVVELEAFIQRNGRLPRQQVKDLVEKRLGSWVSKQKMNYASDLAVSKQIMLTPEVYAEWTALMRRHPLAFETADATWRRSAAEVDTFVEQHGRLPSVKGTDSVEKRLALWIANQKRNYAVEQAASKGIMRTPEVHDQWTALTRRYPLKIKKPVDKRLPTRQQLTMWQRSVVEVQAFVERNGRRPYRTAQDPVEKRLAKWVSHQKANYAADPATSTYIMQTPEVHSEWTAFMELHPLAFESPQAAWQRSVAEVEAFVEQNRRLPFGKATDPIEKRLGLWVWTQRGNYAAEPATSTQIIQTPKLHAEWTAFMERHPLAFETAETKWRRCAVEVEAFIEQNRRLPKVKHSVERRLAMWVSTQKGNYAAEPSVSTQIMQMPRVHAEWTALTRRHPLCLKKRRV
jgi:superfamily II DNA or RNA helicase